MFSYLQPGTQAEVHWEGKREALNKKADYRPWKRRAYWFVWPTLVGSHVELHVDGYFLMIYIPFLIVCHWSQDRTNSEFTPAFIHPIPSIYCLSVLVLVLVFHISLYDCPVCKVVFPNGLLGRPSLHYYSASQLGRLLVPIFAPSSSSSSYYSSSQFRHLLPSHINTWVWNFWRKKRPWGLRVDAGYFFGSEQMNDSECLKKEDA